MKNELPKTALAVKPANFFQMIFGSVYVFWPAFWCAQHPKAGQNTQQTITTAKREREMRPHLQSQTLRTLVMEEQSKDTTTSKESWAETTKEWIPWITNLKKSKS